jgi:uncharacterized membrane protein (DUF2068 family)
VAYKIARATIALSLAVALGIAASLDGGAWLLELARAVREHFTGVWSTHLADALVKASSRRSLAIGTAALTIDGLFVSLEAWALASGRRWGPWLVVVATSALVPFEVYELRRGIHAGRLAILIANVAVVAYLILQRQRESPPISDQS